MTDSEINAFFQRYERFFNRALGGDANLEEVSSLYAAEFIAASPAGVKTGKNDEQLRQVMAQGYARYRAIGTTGMRIRGIRISPIDDYHCVAHVAWTASYTCKTGAELPIDFDVHYFVRKTNGETRIFGWVAGDEEALLRQHGIV